MARSRSYKSLPSTTTARIKVGDTLPKSTNSTSSLCNRREISLAISNRALNSKVYCFLPFFFSPISYLSSYGLTLVLPK